MLTADEQRRYQRHIILPEVGEAGQEKLKGSRILIVGAGGLGSPAALYLAAAGVGTIGIVDDDRVDISNLQRQILHDTAAIGDLKVESASRWISAINPGVCTEKHNLRVSAGNIMQVFEGYDLVIDATDSLEAKFLINDSALRRDMPLVHGGILGFTGQVMTVMPGKGPCYRCLFDEMPESEEERRGCEYGGVFGVLPGIIGSIQAAEAIKVLLGIGEPLSGRLLVFDLLAMSFREVRFLKRESCTACGDK